MKFALDEQETARSNAQIDDAIAEGARNVDRLCNRPPNAMAPQSLTRRFDWPPRTSTPPSWRLWFDGQQLLSATTVTVDNGATTLSPSQYILRPNIGPPYDYLEINLGGSGALSSGSTHQEAVRVIGLWGAGNERKSIGSLASGLAGTTSATASLTWTTARFGVGDVLFVDSEAMSITERSFVDSGQNLTATLALDDAAVTVPVTDPTVFALEEILSVGSERLRIVDIVGSSLVVKRAWDGSQLASHASGTDIYALTGVELQRAELGTTIAAHSLGAAVYQWRPPDLAAELNRAYAINTLLQQRAGYARQSGSGENTTEYTGRSIRSIEADVLQAHGRRNRVRSI